MQFRENLLRQFVHTLSTSKPDRYNYSQFTTIIYNRSQDYRENQHVKKTETLNLIIKSLFFSSLFTHNAMSTYPNMKKERKGVKIKGDTEKLKTGEKIV